MSPIRSENSATSWPSALPAPAYLIIALMARAERSYLETINSFIRFSNSMLELPSRLDRPATSLECHFPMCRGRAKGETFPLHLDRMLVCLKDARIEDSRLDQRQSIHRCFD